MHTLSRIFCAHSRTDLREERSSFSTSTALPVSLEISSAAALALSMLRQRTMTLAPRLLMSFAVSFPMPVLAPERNHFTN